MLADVEAVIGGIYEVGRIHDAIAFQAIDEAFNHIIDSLKSLKTTAVVVVVRIDHCLILLWEAFDPGNTTISN